MFRKRNQSQCFCRVDRLQYLSFLFLASCVAQTNDVPPARFQTSQNHSTNNPALGKFCDKVYPEAGDQSRSWQKPSEGALHRQDFAYAPNAWTWLNLWATWCKPCMEEMPLIKRWNEIFMQDKTPLNVQLWSIDEDPKALENIILPGHVKWLPGEDALQKMLTQMGIDKGSAIPIHAFISPKGKLRCVRVGTISEESFGLVKGILTGS
jgi:hypothetical protein